MMRRLLRAPALRGTSPRRDPWARARHSAAALAHAQAGPRAGEAWRAAQEAPGWALGAAEAIHRVLEAGDRAADWALGTPPAARGAGPGGGAKQGEEEEEEGVSIYAALLVLVVGTLVLRSYALDVHPTLGPSMMPTIAVADDWVLVDVWNARGEEGRRSLARGDVVVAINPQDEGAT